MKDYVCAFHGGETQMLCVKNNKYVIVMHIETSSTNIVNVGRRPAHEDGLINLTHTPGSSCVATSDDGFL